MNDMLLAGIAIVATLVVAGGGAWIARVVLGKKESPKV